MKTGLYAVAYLWAFWYVFILVMGLYRAHLAKRMTPFTYALALPALLVGYAMDVLANILVAPVVFLDAPREWLVTDRLKRYIAAENGWRANLADWVCTHMLDVFDPSGNHC